MRDVVNLVREDSLTHREEFKCFFVAISLLARFSLRGGCVNSILNPLPLPGLGTGINPR